MSESVMAAAARVDAQDREPGVGGAVEASRPAPPPTLRAVAANPAEAEVERMAAEKAEEAAAAVEHARACHALAAAISAAAYAKQRAGGDLTKWTDADAEALYVTAAQIVDIEVAAIPKAAA